MTPERERAINDEQNRRIAAYLDVSVVELLNVKQPLVERKRSKRECQSSLLLERVREVLGGLVAMLEEGDPLRESGLFKEIGDIREQVDRIARRESRARVQKRLNEECQRRVAS